MRGRGDARRTFRLFRRFSFGQRRNYLGATLMLSAEAACAIAVPNVLGWIIDFLKNPSKFLKDPSRPLAFADTFERTIAVAIALMVALEAVKSLADSLAEISLAKGGRTLGYNVRVALFGHLQKLSLAFHVRRRTGDVLTRITSDVLALEEFIVKSVSDLIGSVFLIVGTLIVLFARSWQITLLALVIMPLLASVSSYFARRIKESSKVQRAREGDLASAAQEMLTSISVVQTYGRSGYEERRFAGQSRSAMDAVLRTARLDAMFGFSVSVLEALVLASVIWIGAVAVGEPAISTGTLVALILMMDQMFKPTKRIIKEWNTVAKVYASVERIGDLLDREPAVQDAPDSVDAPRLDGEIEFRDVSFAYQPGPDEDPDAPTRLALDDVSFTIAPGEVVALVGHSGAGKSTIAQLLPRLYDPHAGQVLVDGYDVRGLTVESLRAQISMVLQETVLFSGSVAENIAYGREDATYDEIVAAARQANAHDFITALPDGYDTVLGERAATLSGGQRQRLAIARAFVRDAPILVLDEPTTGLDAESADLVLQALTTLLRGKTAVIVSHDLNLMRVADRMLVISAGRILEEGTAADLLARGGLYAELYARQFGEAAAPAAPVSPVPVGVVDGDGDGEQAAVGRRAFETVLMQAVPLPASPEAFRLLTGRPPPVTHGSPPTQRGPGAGFPVGRPSGPPTEPSGADNGDLDALRARGVGRALPGLTEALDAAAMAPRLQGMLAHGWSVEWCTPGKALIEPGEGGTLRYQVGLREAATGRVVEHLVGGRILPDEDAADDWVRTRLWPLAERAFGRADLAAFERTVDLVTQLRLALHAFPLDPDLPGLLDATDGPRLGEVLGPVLTNPVDGLVLDECRAQVVQYARRGRCVLRYEVLWRLGPRGRTLKQVVYGKAYADDQGALVGDTVAAVMAHAEAAAPAGVRFLVPRFQGYLPDLRLTMLEALPGTPRVPGLVREQASGAPIPDDRRLSLAGALDTCAWIAATLHTCPARPTHRRDLAGEIRAVRSETRALVPYAPALAALLEEQLGWAASVAAATTPGADSFAHGDLTPAQVLFDGPLSGLVDFDTACVAEPALDLGQFVAYLDLAVGKAEQRTGSAVGGRLTPADAFLDEYNRARGFTDPAALRERVAAYRTVALTRVAARSWRQLKPRRVRLALAVLDAQIPQGLEVRG